MLRRVLPLRRPARAVPRPCGSARVARLFGLLCLTLAVAGSAPPGAADAAPYEVWSCRDATGAPIGTGAWFVNYDFTTADQVESSDDCATPAGGLRVALRPDQTRSISGLDLRFDRPRGTQIVDYELWRSATVLDPLASPSSFYEVGVEEIVTGAAVTSRACDNGLGPVDCGTDAADPLAAANHLAKDAAGPLDTIKLFARCRSNRCDPAATPVAATTLYRSRVRLDDPTPPAVAAPTGTLLAGPASGTGTVQVAARDGESGVAAVSLAVDGGAPATIDSGNPLNGCRLPYADPRPCPTDTAPLFLVDTAALTPGPHTVTGAATDAAGNVTPWGPVAFEVAPPKPDPPTPEPPVVPPLTPPLVPPPTAPPVQGGVPDNGSPAVAQPRIRLQAGPAQGARTRRISGSVRTAGGTPIAGARIVLLGRPLGLNATADQELARAVSDAQGQFVVPRLPSGAYRVTASFSPWAGAAPTVARRIRARSDLQLTTSASPRRLRSGRSVSLRGQLRGAGPATHQTLLQIEAIVGGSWRPVGAVRVDRHGNWRWRYRFRSVTRPTRFTFRASVATAPAWPWPTLRGPRVEVRVDAP